MHPTTCLEPIMHIWKKTLAATTILAAVPFAAPAVSAQEATGDLTCREEVGKFLETVRGNDSYPRLQATFAAFERRLVVASGEAEEDCFAVLADAQAALVEAGVVISGATDAPAVSRVKQIAARLVSEAEASRVGVQVKPAQVAVGQRPANVNVQQDATEVDVATRAPQIEVRQPQTSVNVKAPQQQVDVTQPEAQVTVNAAAPQVAVTQPPPQITVEQQQPNIAVRQTKPTVTVNQPEPEIIVRQFQPQIDIRQPKPTITVEQPEPDVAVIQPEPIVTVEAARPQVEVTRAEPTVSVNQPPPEVNVTQRKPEVEVRQPEPQVNVEETEPQISVSQAEPRVSVNQADPQVNVRQPRARVEVAQGEPQVTVSQAEPEIVANLSEGADMTATREEGEPQVDVTKEDAATVSVETSPADVIRDIDIAALVEIDAVAVREVEFGFDSATVTPDARQDVLRDVARLVERSEDAVVLLTGYASPVGDAEYNRQLAERRVQAVASVLRGLDVPPEVIRTRSLGELNQEVAASESRRSEENRRVEIRVIAGENIPRG